MRPLITDENGRKKAQETQVSQVGLNVLREAGITKNIRAFSGFSVVRTKEGEKWKRIQKRAKEALQKRIRKK